MPGVSRETAIVENHGPVEDRHADIADTTVSFVTWRRGRSTCSSARPTSSAT